jgi:AraC family transcriptional regulator
LKAIILSFFAAIILFFAAELYFSGAFKPVEIGVQTKGPYAILFKEHIGAYDKIASTIEEVETWAKQNNLPCALTFGEYFDDPHAVEQERLRSRGGCIMELKSSTEKNPYTQVIGAFPTNAPVLPSIQTSILEERKFVVATFKGSPRIGPLKVYPKVSDYFSSNSLKQGSSSVEIYEIYPNNSGMTTTYLFPIEK